MTQTKASSGVHIVITGASSGIGAALAEYYAAPGIILSLWARNTERLSQMAEKARAKGAQVFTTSIDLMDAQKALDLLKKTDDARAVDILILSAGISDIRPADRLVESAETALRMSMVNFTTPVTLACEAAERMGRRRQGRICLLGSVASFHDLPLATVYAGSKAGVGRFATALHAAMTPHNVGVTLVTPGFVDTPMSQRLEGDQPFLVPVAQAAAKIARAISYKRAMLLFPWVFQLTRALEMMVPRPLAHKILRRLEIMQHPLPRDDAGKS